MKTLLYALGWVSVFLAVVNLWFMLGALVFFGGMAVLSWLERVQDRVVAELAKTCMCPLCKAARGE